MNEKNERQKKKGIKLDNDNYGTIKLLRSESDYKNCKSQLPLSRELLPLPVRQQDLEPFFLPQRCVLLQRLISLQVEDDRVDPLLERILRARYVSKNALLDIRSVLDMKGSLNDPRIDDLDMAFLAVSSSP